MALPHYTKQELSIYPSNLPKGLINTLIVACLLLGLAALRSSKGMQGWLNVIENWVFMLLWIPLAVTLCALLFLTDEFLGLPKAKMLEFLNSCNHSNAIFAFSFYRQAAIDR